MMKKNPSAKAEKKAPKSKNLKPNWKPGQSGNPNGRAMGSRNKATIAIETLLDGEAEALTRKAVELARNGDIQALKLCLERICPPRKSRPISIDLPKVETVDDISKAHEVVIAAMAIGDVTPEEANVIAGVIDAKRRAIETVELEKRIQELEETK